VPKLTTHKQSKAEKRSAFFSDQPASFVNQYETSMTIEFQVHRTWATVIYEMVKDHERSATQLSRFIRVLRLRRERDINTPSHFHREREKRLIRNELTRLYHWKQRKLMAPLNLNKRPIENSRINSLLLVDLGFLKIEFAVSSTLWFNGYWNE